MLSLLPSCLQNQFLSFILGHIVQYKHDMDTYTHTLSCILKQMCPVFHTRSFLCCCLSLVSDMEAAERSGWWSLGRQCASSSHRAHCPSRYSMSLHCQLGFSYIYSRAVVISFPWSLKRRITEVLPLPLLSVVCSIHCLQLTTVWKY